MTLSGGEKMQSDYQGRYERNPFTFIGQQLRAASEVAASDKLPDGERLAARHKRKLLLAVLAYIRDGGWCKSQKARERLFSLTAKGYTKTCAELEITRGALVNTVSRYRVALIKRIGNDFAYFLKNNRIEEAAELFIARSQYKGITLIPESTRELLPDPEDSPDIALEDTQAELWFLHTYCSRRIRQHYLELETSKLAKLMYIIESGDSRYSAEQSLIISFLAREECDLDGLMKNIRQLY
jgi:hypothetical protein